MDYPELDITMAMYGYNEKAREKAGWLQVEAMLKIPKLFLVEELEREGHILSSDEVLWLEVDEHKMFHELDKVRVVCLLGPPISPPNP